MKRYIRSSSTNAFQDELDLLLSQMECIVVTDNAFNEDLFQYVRASKNEIDYRYLTDSQLSELSNKEIHRITDVGTLRRIPKDRLTVNQLRMVTQSNKVEQINIPVSKVKDILTTLKNCTYVAWQRFRPKNAELSKSLRAEGIILKDSDVTAIVKGLHVSDFSHGKYSYEEDSWCNLWAVFEFNGPYIFHDKHGNEVKKDYFNVYIKIESQPDSDGSVALISFHDPEYKMSHPYENYPINKE